MLVLKTDMKVTSEFKDELRKEIKDRTGEDCLILDMGFNIEQIKIKKEQPLWRRLFRLG